jgi:hypothetical protein
MVSNVTMHEPGAWIVSLKSDNHISVGWKQDDVTAWRVSIIQGQAVRKCSIFDLLEDCEVVAVQVYLISSRCQDV